MVALLVMIMTGDDTVVIISVDVVYIGVNIDIVAIAAATLFFSSPLETFFSVSFSLCVYQNQKSMDMTSISSSDPDFCKRTEEVEGKNLIMKKKQLIWENNVHVMLKKKIRKMRGCLPPSASFDDCTFSSASGIFRRFVSRKQFNYLRMGATYFKEATDIKCRKGQWEGGMKYIMWNFFLSQNGFLEKFRASLQNCVFGR